MSELCAVPALRRSNSAHPFHFSACDARLVLTGDLDLDVVGDLDFAVLRNLPQNNSVINIGGLERINTAEAWFLVNRQQRASAAGNNVTFEGATEAQAQVTTLCAEACHLYPQWQTGYCNVLYPVGLDVENPHENFRSST